MLDSIFSQTRLKCLKYFLTPWHGTQQLSLFQQVQCSPVAAGLRRELQFCHQWGEEKFSPIPALVPLPQWGQWSRHQRRRWVNIYKAAILARKMKKEFLMIKIVRRDEYLTVDWTDGTHLMMTWWNYEPSLANLMWTMSLLSESVIV